MSYILIWNPKYGHIGHVSLRVSSDIYISLWPTTEHGPILYAFNHTSQSRGTTYNEDCIYEGNEDKNGKQIPRIPDEEIQVNGTLNNEKIKKWWETYKNNGYSRRNNCCDAVKKALKVGDLPKEELSSLYETLDNKEIYFTSNCITSLGGKKQ